jgi:hypothetical protein
MRWQIGCAVWLFVVLSVAETKGAHLHYDPEGGLKIGGWIGPADSLSMPRDWQTIEQLRNDDYRGTDCPNQIVYQLGYVLSEGCHIGFFVDSDGGTTEYRFNLDILNNTADDWLGFQVELGYLGVGPSFLPAGTNAPMDFDAPMATADHPTTSSNFSLYEHTPQMIRWYDGVLHPQESAVFSFPVDLADGAPLVMLRQTPIVPEPSTLAMLAVGAILFATVRRRARRAAPQ